MDAWRPYLSNWSKSGIRRSRAATAPMNRKAHKASGMAMIVAGHAGRLATGMHSRVMDTAGDLYLTHTKLSDRFTLRMSIGGTNTERRHVERAWKRIQEEADGVGHGE